MRENKSTPTVNEWIQLTGWLPLGLSFPISTVRGVNQTGDLAPKSPPGQAGQTCDAVWVGRGTRWGPPLVSGRRGLAPVHGAPTSLDTDRWDF